MRLMMASSDKERRGAALCKYSVLTEVEYILLTQNVQAKAGRQGNVESIYIIC